MSKWMVRTGPLAAAAVLGCSGVGQWSSACSCAEPWQGFVSEIDIPIPHQDKSVTPEAVRQWFVARYKGREVDLASVRALGLSSNAACAEHRFHQIKCVYWLWTREDGAHRAIEVTFTSTKPDHDIQTRYVTEGS